MFLYFHAPELITLCKKAQVHKIHKNEKKSVPNLTLNLKLWYQFAPSELWRGTLTPIGSFMWAGLTGAEFG